MTALLDVASYLPAESLPIAAHLSWPGCGENVELFKRYYGFSHVRVDHGRSLEEQLAAAAANLATLPGRERDVRYVVHAPTIQVTAPYPVNPVANVCRRLGLDAAVPFSLSQHACASALLAVDVCGRLLDSDGDPDALALVLAGEKTFTKVAQFIPNTAVMGETKAAVLVSAHGDRDRMVAYRTCCLGEYYLSPYMSQEDEARFQNAYTGVLTGVIRGAVADAGLTVDQVVLILPHNVNRLSWLRVLGELGLPRERIVLDNQAELGHCFGADPFVNLLTAVASGRLRPGDHYVMTATGLGATLAAMVFRH